MEINKRPFWFALFSSVTPVYDAQGFETGEKKITYGTPTPMKANISAATGQAQIEQFGNLDNYDKVIVTDWMQCPIDENSVLCIDKPVTYDAAGELEYDYIVRRVAKSLNVVSIAVRKVKTT